MDIYLTRNFLKWAKRSRLTIESIVEATIEIESGLVDVNLGNGLYKKRIARPGKGKRSGFRTIVAYKNDRAFYIHGFAKSAQENILNDEILALRLLANQLMSMTKLELEIAESSNKLVYVKYHDQRH